MTVSTVIAMLPALSDPLEFAFNSHASYPSRKNAMYIRSEQPADYTAIHDIIVAAFAHHPYSQQTEQKIVAALRAAGALTISLVAALDDEIVGHVACSPILINDKTSKWFGLGPVAVRPDRQGKGIGAALIRASIKLLSSSKAGGIALLGEPAYYERFGFQARPALRLTGVPASHFLSLPLSDTTATGVVTYYEAFAIRGS